MNSWNIKEEHFKTKKDMRAKLEFLLGYAILAPSGYNSQPWKFRIDENKIEIYSDFAKKRRVIDPGNREIYVSVGAALENLLIVAKYFGFETKTKVIKITGEDKKLDLVATVEFQDKKSKDESLNKKMFEAIRKRQTNRRPFEKLSKDTKKLEKRIKDLIEDREIEVRLFDEENIKKKIGSLMAQASLYWYSKENFRKELLSWLRDDTETKNINGLWQKYYGRKDRMGVLNFAEEKAMKDEMMVVESPILMIISSKKDNKENWIKTGRNLEKILLYLTSEDISHAYFNSIVESDKQRIELGKEFNNGIPQLVLRLGKAKKVMRSSRSTIEEVLIS